jgi:WhiB family redox-sensing transcriptional regulator
MVLGFQSPPDWFERALCAEVGPDPFFPKRGGSVAPAVSICRACPVRAECLAYAMDVDDLHGVWGGMSEQGRKKARRERRAS